ncbi:hypothetical protein JKP88DRAFT_261635 [Tribonema minus]|uniref:Uncharacterized protein n=1 Tax=Tribonema minus TaxID=303371 RepID=A0A836C8D1_9STRA|nr:hypothetical protein JKP88DRAFT_261635 [Tribonema minus]
MRRVLATTVLLAAHAWAGASAASDVIALPRVGEVSAQLSTKPQVLCYDSEAGWTPLRKPSAKVLCYDSEANWTPLRALWIWSPVHIAIAASVPDAAIAVRAASEDDLHHAVEGLILRTLSTDGDNKKAGGVDAQAMVSRPPQRLPSWIPGGALVGALAGGGGGKGCPSLWSSDRSRCSMYVSAFGRTCLAVRAADRRDAAVAPAAGEKFTVTTTSEFRPELITLAMLGLMVLFMSGEFAKSKVFQYVTGAGLGVTFGALLLVTWVFRKKAARHSALVTATAAAYAGSLLALIKSQVAQVFASHWELVLAYVIASAALGLFLVRVVRSNPENKHRVRTLSKWSVRLLGVYMVQCSTYSGAMQALYLVALVIVYARYALSKNGFWAPKSAGKRSSKKAK